MSIRTIWKFGLQLTDRQTIEMPRAAEVLTAQMQGNTLCLWAEVVIGRHPEKREFLIIGTGNPIDPSVEKKYIGTVQQNGFVWHVFEKLATPTC